MAKPRKIFAVEVGACKTVEGQLKVAAHSAEEAMALVENGDVDTDTIEWSASNDVIGDSITALSADDTGEVCEGDLE